MADCTPRARPHAPGAAPAAAAPRAIAGPPAFVHVLRVSVSSRELAADDDLDDARPGGGSPGGSCGGASPRSPAGERARRGRGATAAARLIECRAELCWRLGSWIKPGMRCPMRPCVSPNLCTAQTEV